MDFGTGDQGYKADWIEDVRPRYRIDCLDPAQVRAWPPLAKRVISRIDTLLRPALAPAPRDS